MSNARDRLSALEVKKLKIPGMYHDGGGLYLQVSNFGTKSWILRFTMNKRTRDMGLGPLTDWTLAEARERARKYRQLVDDGIDPIEHRDTERKQRAAELERQKTFEQCAEACHADKTSSWKNDKHKAQWINTLRAYAFPVIGTMNVAEVCSFPREADPGFPSRFDPSWGEPGRLKVWIRSWAWTPSWRAGRYCS